MNYSTFPHNYDDISELYQKYWKEDGDGEAVFSWNDLSKGGRSYSFYDNKIFEFYPGDKAKLRVWGRMLPALDILKPGADGKKLYALMEKDFPLGDIEPLIRAIRDEKKRIFRSIIIEDFACCNDFVACSDAQQCIHPDDPFYNGCYYRVNLEAGRIFYGKNANNK